MHNECQSCTLSDSLFVNETQHSWNITVSTMVECTEYPGQLPCMDSRYVPPHLELSQQKWYHIHHHLLSRTKGTHIFNVTSSKISCCKTRFQFIFQMKHGTVWASVPLPNLALTWHFMGIAGSWSNGRGHVMRTRSKLPCQDTWCNSLDNRSHF